MRLKHRKPLVLEFIRRYIASNQEAPTIREIGRHFHLSSSASVYDILRALEKDGLIKRSRYGHRGTEIVGN